MIFSHNCIWNCFKISTIPKWTYCQFIFSMECFIYLCFCYLIWTEYLNCSSLNVKLWYLLWFLLVILLSCFKICFLQISITFIMSSMFFFMQVSTENYIIVMAEIASLARAIFLCDYKKLTQYLNMSKESMKISNSISAASKSNL